MKVAALLLVVLAAAPLPVSARQAAGRPRPEPVVAQELKRLTIEELAELEVTSVSRRIERLAETAAAVSVVRQDDIRRSGAITLAEAMRLADGLDVARSDGRTWNITARGFNIVAANKLLVLMDGRTLYSPLFAGTFWDVQDTLLADIDRVEVVRGPGGTVWGANAVNGVINIITRAASETRGNAALLATGVGGEVIASARHGARLGRGGSYRIFGKYRRQGANVFASGESSEDPVRFGMAGFRMDADPRRDSRWRAQGTVYLGKEGLFGRDDVDVRGGFAQGGWSRRFTRSAELQVDAYYDNTYRKVPLQFEEDRHTVEIDVHHQVVSDRHDVLVGGEYRVSHARAIGGATFSFVPEERTNSLAGVFVQDEMRLGARFFVTLGSKFEANDYTGLEVQPTARVRWSRGDAQTLWGAVSRAVRLPTRVDTDIRVRNAAGMLVTRGNEDFQSESVVAYEAGYRVRPHARMAVDLATFANRYDNLRSQEVPSRFGAVALLANGLEAVTTGLEGAVTLQVIDRLRLHGSASYLHKALSLDPGSLDRTRGATEGNDPRYQVKLRSYLDLPRGLALDAVFRHVDRRPAPAVPGYSSLDLRLGWVARPGIELSLIGQNLLDPSHPEFGLPGPARFEFERGLYVRSTWRF